ncbi:hypothetical protein H257_00427 [Aphanomyces astaci]|uniref:Uncharacterized protein n=1 Tax=Aphanomyces astaci TaxID=112090 RepID=W4HD18_APHAT|nr:hypothetical protein H257_00427 [Aphanomyces astaci]ETV89023.1 hypothetical protein H257_00427 [Aphanomyces astaci]|eukprot:XP_009821423.1 hypothetical protein H257_00427 [Aphanomyces astaci]
METAVIRTGRELSETEKIAVVRYLQDNLVNGKLARGAIARMSSALPRPCSATGQPGDLEDFEFTHMWDVVHLDEKWFNSDKDRRKVYLTKRETPRRRSCKSKLFLPKVMFLAAVARPRWDIDRDSDFDGNIGMWPFVEQLPAAPNSRNRHAGTMVTQLVAVTSETYQDFVMNKHDNATPHRILNASLLRLASTDGWT